MSTAKVTYLGRLRTSCEHLASGTNIITDAPVDNKGQGQAFSPTDIVATALASCILTIIGIKATEINASIEGAQAVVNKVMASNPRRISQIKVEITLPSQDNLKTQIVLERAGNTCPVFYSLHPDIQKNITYNWV